MSFLNEIDLGEDFAPFQFFKANLGFVPNLFRAQSHLPRALPCEAELTNLLLLQPGGLSTVQRQSLLLRTAAARQNEYGCALHGEMLCSLGISEDVVSKIAGNHREADLTDADCSLLDFALKLERRPLSIGQRDVDNLRGQGFTDDQILEAELLISYAVFACTLATGLGVAPDFSRRIAYGHISLDETDLSRSHDHGPYLSMPDLGEEFWPYPFFQQRLGFVPCFFRAQSLRPDLIEAQARALDVVLLSGDILTRLQKEFIFLVISAANLNTYCVANHCGVLRGLGIPADVSDQIAFNHHEADLPPRDVTLLDFALKLTQHPDEFSANEIKELQEHEFSEPQIVEAVLLSAFANFVNTMNIALGVGPDFEAKHVFQPEHLSARGDLKALGEISLSKLNLSVELDSLRDEDAPLVAQVCRGELNAFEELVRRHHQRVFRTLVGIMGNWDEAEDAAQNVFLKAFKGLKKFSGNAKFSTWLTRIAINEGLEQLRRRQRHESIDEDPAATDVFQPRQVQSWVGNPEQLYSQKELRELVERALMTLPPKYRLAVILRDLEQLTNQEAALALGLSLEAFKSRLWRGRLALREALAPHFKGGKEFASV